MPSRCIALLLLMSLSLPALAGMPERIHHSNLNESQISISWVTAASEMGKINYGLTTGLGTIVTDSVTDDVHHITLTSLTPETTYYYDIISGTTTDNNNGQHYTFKTVKSLANPPVGSDLVYGRVFKADGITPAKGAVVYIILQDNDKSGSIGESSIASVRIDDNGYWFTSLVNFRTANNTAVFTYSLSGDNLFLQVEGGNDGSVNKTIDIVIGSPAQPITLASDRISPYMRELSPAKNAINIKPDTRVTLHVCDDGSGVDKTSIVMKINGQKVIPNSSGSISDYFLEYIPSSPFTLGQKVVVDITAQDITKNTFQGSYSFTIINDTQSPYTLYHYPAKNAVNVSVGSMVILHVLDDVSGVDTSSIVMKVKGVIVTPVITGSNKDYTVVCSPAGGFKYGEQASVSITARDLSQPPNTFSEEYVLNILPDKMPPFVTDRYPKKDSIDVRPDTNIIIYLKDDLSGIDKSSIVLLINNKIVLPEIIGVSSYFILLYTPPERFGYSQKVNIEIQAKDLAVPPNAMAQEIYSFTTIKDPDVTAPYADGYSPAKNADNIPVDTSIVFHIKDAQSGVDKSSIKLQINAATVTPVISGTVTDFTVTYKPQVKFGYNQKISVAINAKDLSGNIMAEDAYTFTTGNPLDAAPPYTSGHQPSKGAIDVATNTTILVHIKDDGVGVNNTSIEMLINGSKVTHGVSGTKTDYAIVFKPSANFNYSQQVQVIVRAKDLSGNAMIADTYTFTIVNPPPDTAPPYTSGHQPSKGAIDVATNTTILVHIKDDGVGVNNTSIEMLINGSKVTPVISGTKTDYTAAFKPIVNFGYEQQVQVIVNAKDISGNAMLPESYSFKTASMPITTSPSLSWTGEAGYENDGIAPDTCNLKGTVKYCIKYTDPDNIPPRSEYPKLNIYLNGKLLKNTIMSVANIKDTIYRDGKIYWYSYIIPSLGSYSYKFEAMNQKGTVAVGAPIISSNGPVVEPGNRAPQLKYFYPDGGVSPNTGNPGSRFEYRVIYSDADNHLPSYNYPILHLTLNGKALNSIPMEAVETADTNVIDGKVYRTTISLASLGNYTYRFDALDAKGMKAEGEAAILKNGPNIQRLNTSPTLELGFDSNKGVNPDKGKGNTVFEWRVKYTDAENDQPLSGFPKIYIYKAGKQYLLLTMTPVDAKDTNYMDGKLYSIKRALVAAANYSYKFVAMDMLSALTEQGPIQGPLVSASSPGDTAFDDVSSNIGYPYPNPVFDSNPVSFFNIEQGSNFKIYNLAGELVFEGVYDENGWTPPSNLSSGIYLYLIEHEGSVIRGKLGIIR
ncbi:MAG: Ig-like domain-containing protein [bacterium]|nr:Ig-like domain-containing protein [bacterium]